MSMTEAGCGLSAGPRCALLNAGLVSYEDGLQLQKKAREMVSSGEWDGVLILLEHLPVITFGNSGGRENLRLTDDELTSQGVSVIATDRGGSITCHNPGQLVGYPVLNLEKWQKDVHLYVRQLEETLIRTLSEYGFRAGRKSRYTGVWLADEKIAAIGVSVRRWITGHGFALNIHNNLGLFNSIVPCGIREFGVTSMSDQGCKQAMAEVSGTIARQFSKTFQCELEPIK